MTSEGANQIAISTDHQRHRDEHADQMAPIAAVLGGSPAPAPLPARSASTPAPVTSDDEDDADPAREVAPTADERPSAARSP
jgi:hypothetical protein